jgi:rhodanese-related sulfurtransferase
MIYRNLKQDLAWAGIILLLTTVFGLSQQWRLVHLSWTGRLAPLLEQQREQRRRAEFQGVATLSLPQAYQLFQEGRAVFVDARNPEEYAELRIPGSINLPPQRLEKEGVEALAGISMDRQLVVYCSQVSCDAALKVAEKLQSLGYTGVAAFLSGFRAWDEAGYPAETGK